VLFRSKELHADLREGKLTLPLLRAIAQRKELLPMLVSAREGDDVAAERLIQAVRATSGAEEARALARMETSSALLALGRLPPSPARDLLGAVARELTARAF
jgi:geranylgeranyl pyrophosphate synthase